MVKVTWLASNDVTEETTTAVPTSREGKSAVAMATRSYAEAAAATLNKNIILG